jgi:hypothetical protein
LNSHLLSLVTVVLCFAAESNRSTSGVNVGLDVIKSPCLCSTVVFQVYGGVISATVGSDVWSFISFGSSSAISLDTRCLNCRMQVANVSISESSALASSAFSQGIFVRVKLL